VHLDPLRRIRSQCRRLLLRLAQPHQTGEIARQPRALDRAQHLLDGEEENVALALDERGRGELAPDREKEAARPTEDAGALEAQILAVAHARLGPADKPECHRPANRSAGEAQRQARQSVAPRPRLACRSARGGRDCGKERRRILGQRPALEFQLLEAAVAECGDMVADLAPQLGRIFHQAAIAGGQSIDDRGIPGRERAHAGDAPRRLGRDDVALADHDVVVEREALGAGPALDQLARGAERHHAEKVVNERGVPAIEQLGLDAAILGGERRERHRAELGRGPRQRASDARIESGDGAATKRSATRATRSHSRSRAMPAAGGGARTADTVAGSGAATPIISSMKPRLSEKPGSSASARYQLMRL